MEGEVMGRMRNEMVLADVRCLIRKRKEASRMPLCVTLEEVISEQRDFSRSEILDALHQLEQEGSVRLRPAINCLTVYLID